MIVNNKGGLGEETTFDFKYIPNLSKKTQMEDASETGVNKAKNGIERRNLQALGIGCFLIALAGFFGFKISAAIVKRGIELLP